MQHCQHQLKNGLTLVAECNPNAYMAAFGFFVKTGARDESPEIGGVSHFLEHMVFKGTLSRTADTVNLELDEMGSSSNARTGEESTVYHACVLPEFQTPLVELLADLMRPSLRESDFETEKQVILEEIMMYQDQPPYGGHERVMELFFDRHPLGQSILGTAESVGRLTAEEMKQYFRRRYLPSNMALAAAGNVDFDELVAVAERCCGAWTNGLAVKNKTQAVYRCGFETLHKPQSHQQYLLQLAPGPANDDPRRFALRAAVTILGDEGGSRLFWRLLDPGLVESAGTGSYEFHQNGIIMSYIACAPVDAQANLNILYDLQREFSQSGVSQRELDLAKQKIISHILLASERTETRLFSVGSHWLNAQPFRTAAEIAEIYEGLTLDEVNQAIQDFPLTQNMTLSVGPTTSIVPPTA
jgi:predicted Zn-dependent peptidase